MITVYTSGPMRGLLDNNFPAFDVARDRLVKRGYRVISPADIDRVEGETDSRGYAERDTKAILGCDKMYLLKGWESSVGAAAEFFLARWIGLEIECESGSTDPLHDFALTHSMYQPSYNKEGE